MCVGGGRLVRRALSRRISPFSGRTAPASAGPRPGYGSGSPGPEPAHPYLTPRCAAICKITMGITMGYMLILML